MSQIIYRQSCACPKLGPGFPKPRIVVYFVFNDMRREVVLRFVYIDRIVDYHYFNIIFTSDNYVLSMMNAYIYINPTLVLFER